MVINYPMLLFSWNFVSGVTADEVLKWDGNTWLRLVLVELLEERALMGWMGPRYGKEWEAKRGRGVFSFSIFNFDWVSKICTLIYLSGWKDGRQPTWYLPSSLKLLGLWNANLKASKSVISMGYLVSGIVPPSCRLIVEFFNEDCTVLNVRG